MGDETARLRDGKLIVSTTTGPLLQLIAGGIKLWIRSRCDSIGELQLELHGSGLGLLRGHLRGAVLMARDVSFQGLPLQHADLRSGPIQVDVKLLQPGRMLSLQQPFVLQGEVTMTGRGLNQALLKEPWRWLGDWLAEQLMGLTPLGRLHIDNDVLELQAPVVAHKDLARRRFRLCADQGTLLIRPLDRDQQTLLPMDPTIQIEQAELCGGLLHLKGKADVTP